MIFNARDVDIFTQLFSWCQGCAKLHSLHFLSKNSEKRRLFRLPKGVQSCTASIFGRKTVKKSRLFPFPKGVQLCAPFRALLHGCATLRSPFLPGFQTGFLISEARFLCLSQAFVLENTLIILQKGNFCF